MSALAATGADSLAETPDSPAAVGPLEGSVGKLCTPLSDAFCSAPPGDVETASGASDRCDGWADV